MSFFKNRNNSEIYKAVFSVSIETNYEYRGDSSKNTLVPGGEYWFEKNEKHATYDDLKDFAINVLNNELDDECKQFIDIPIHDIKVKSIYEGSIELFFIVIFGVIASVSGIKDLYDSIDLLQSLAEKKLEKRFREKYGDYFRIDVKKQIPRNTYYDDINYLHKHHASHLCYARNNKQSQRDGFFYYLFISNVLLITIVIALVVNAVAKVYF